MRLAAIICLFAALACGAFAFWGIETVAGRRMFDEMAGMIPLGVALFGALSAIFGLFAWWRRGR